MGMKIKRWIALAAVFGMTLPVHAQYTIYYGNTGSTTDFAGPKTLSYGIDATGNLTGNNLGGTIETLTGNTNYLANVASFMDITAYDLNGVAPSIVADGTSADFLEANVSGSGWDTSGLTDIGFRFKDSGASMLPGTGNNNWVSASELMIIELTVPPGAATMTFGYDGTSEHRYYLVGDTDIDDGRGDSVTETLFAGETRTLLLWNKGANAKRITSFSVDFTEATSNFEFGLTPDDSQDIQAGYPAILATNSIVAEYANSAVGVEITALNVTSPSNSISAVTVTPFTMNSPVPANAALEFEFDASAVKAITSATEAFNATGSVDVVWKNLDDNILQTNTVELVGKFRNPPFEFTVDESLSIILSAPATVASNDIAVSYVPGRPGYTNVEIVAVNILDEEHQGAFSASNPGVLQEPEPSSDVITVTFDNGVAGLGNKDSSTCIVEVVYGEVGSGTVSTSTVPVSAFNYDLAAGVIQQVFGEPVDVQLGVGSGLIPMNNFAAYTNKWNANANFEQELTQAALTLPSGGNTRSAYNLVEANTAGSDNFGAVDTSVLTNGLYRYDFDYSVSSTDGDNVIWSFNAYALINQQDFPVSNNNDKVQLDVATGTSGGIDVDIRDDGDAYYSRHANGTIGGTGDVVRTTGSVYLNIQDDQDALFVMHRSGKCTVRMYDLVLTRVGEYVLPVNSTNAVLAAQFEDLSATNSIFTVGASDTNTNAVDQTWRGVGLSLDSRKLKSNANDTAVRATGTIIRRNTVGYDDVGVQDTIALTAGTYDLMLDVEVIDSFPSNESIARVEFYALTQDASGTNNYVKIDHGPGTNEYMKVFGEEASATLLASKTYTTNAAETLMLTNLNVQADQDVAIVFYHSYGPDFLIDNVELLRTGDLPLEGYGAWAEANGLTAGVNDGLEDDAENGGLGDGLNNLMEYALGGDPLVDDAATVAPQTSEAGGYFYHVYKERTDDPTLTFTVDLNENLTLPGGWGAAGLEAEERGPDNGEFQMVTNSTDTLEAAEFIRLQVEKD